MYVHPKAADTDEKPVVNAFLYVHNVPSERGGGSKKDILNHGIQDNWWWWVDEQVPGIVDVLVLKTLL